MRMAVMLAAVVAVLSSGMTAQAPDAASTAPPPRGNASQAQAAVTRSVATMKELMVDLIFPTSDAIFYVGRTEPKTDMEWFQVQLNALMLAESANVLMMPGRARDQEQWMRDAKLLLDVGEAAYRGAKARNLDALLSLNDQLYESCQSCHEHYRPNYRRRP